MRILLEEDTLVFGQEQDKLRALGNVAMLTTLSPVYAQEKAFPLIDRMAKSISANTYGFLYERTNKDAPIEFVVGFASWAYMSRPISMIFKQGLRPLEQADFHSGKEFWVVDFMAPMGHALDFRKLFEEYFSNEPEFNTRRIRDRQYRAVKMKNKYFKSKQAAGEI